MKRIFIILMICCCTCGLFAGTAEDMQSRFDSGMRAMKSGDYDEAIRGFQEMLEENSDLPRVRLELARAYSLAGKRMLAAREFKSVLDLNPPDQVRENIERYLNSISGVPKLDVDVSVGYMYDDNVTAGTSDDVVYFYGLPFTLDGAAKQQSDSALMTGVRVNYVVPVGDMTSWVSSVNFDSTDYCEWNQFDFQMFRGSTGLAWKKGKIIWRLPVVFDYAFLGSDRYSGGIGVRPGFSLFLKDDFIVSSSVLFERKQHYLRDDRSGYLTGLDLSARKGLPWGFFVDAGCQFWQEDTVSSLLSNDTNVLYGVLSKNLAKGLTLRVTSAFSWSDYDEGSFAFGNKAREDFRKRLSVSLRKDTGKNNSLSVEYSRTENDSNLGFYDFDRNQIGVNFEHRF